MGYAMRVDTYRFEEWYCFDHVNAAPNFEDYMGYNHPISSMMTIQT